MDVWERMGLVTRGQMLLLSGIKRRGDRRGEGREREEEREKVRKRGRRKREGGKDAKMCEIYKEKLSSSESIQIIFEK